MNKILVKLIFKLICLIFILLTFIQLSSQSFNLEKPNEIPIQVNILRKINQKCSNSTLNTAGIFIISLPFRTDRQDSVFLRASLSGITVNIVDGIKGDLIPDKVLPEGAKENLNPAEIGIWRAHVNIWQNIVKNNWESAVIMEDDADWDYNIRQQIGELNINMKSFITKQKPLNNNSDNNDVNDENNDVLFQKEYDGNTWDIIIIGACGDRGHPTDPTFFKWKDSSAPKDRDMLDEGVANMLLPNIKNIRLLAKSFYPLCSTGYLVSQRGARRLLHNIGLLKVRQALDLEFIYLIQDNIINSWTVYPPYLMQIRDGSSKDSDTQEISLIQSQHIYKNRRTSKNIEKLIDKQLNPTCLW